MKNVSIYTDNSMTHDAIAKIPTKLNEFVNIIISKSNEMLNTPSAAEIQKIDWSSIASILGTISIILILSILFLLALYLLRSIGLYVMSKREGRDFAWLAFVPFGCLFSFGLITGKTKLFGIEIDHAEFLLPSLFLATFVPYVGCLATVLFIISKYAMLYRIYENKAPNFATILTILSILIPFLSPIILFSIRDK